MGQSSRAPFSGQDLVHVLSACAAALSQLLAVATRNDFSAALVKQRRTGISKGLEI